MSQFIEKYKQSVKLAEEARKAFMDDPSSDNFDTFYEAWEQALIEAGFIKGLRQGRADGYKLGFEKATRCILQNLLVQKFGSISPECMSRIESFRFEQFEHLYKWVFVANSVEIVETYFKFEEVLNN